MREFLLRHWRNTVYSNVWIALGALVWVYAAGWEIGGRQWVAPLLAFFATVFVYNFQRVVKLSRRKEAPVSSRNRWMAENQLGLWVWVFVGAIGGLFIGLFLPLEGWKLLVIPAGISLLYVARIIPSKHGRITLREVPGMKILWIAACWAWVGSFLPGVFDLNPDGRVWWMWGEKCAFILAITIPFDIRDLKYDAEYMHTLPQLLGAKRAVRLALLLLVVSGVLVLGGTLSRWYHLPYAIATWISLLPTAWLVAQSREDQPELFFTGRLDGTLVLQGGLQCIALWFT